MNPQLNHLLLLRKLILAYSFQRRELLWFLKSSPPTTRKSPSFGCMSFELYKIEISLHLRKSQWRRNSASLKLIHVSSKHPCFFLCTSPQQTLSVLWDLPVNWPLHFSWTTNDSKTTESVSYLCWKINITLFNSVEWTHFTQERNIFKKPQQNPQMQREKGHQPLKIFPGITIHMA